MREFETMHKKDLVKHIQNTKKDINVLEKSEEHTRASLEKVLS